MKIQSRNIYFKNTLDPHPSSVGPPDIYRPYAKSKISRDKFRTNISDAQISGVYHVYSIDYGVLCFFLLFAMHCRPILK